MNNYLIIKQIVKILDNSKDILNFIRVNKFTYVVVNSIRFVHFPIDFYLEEQNREENFFERLISATFGKVDKIAKIPLKFKKILIGNKKQFVLYHSTLKHRYDIAEVLYYCDLHRGSDYPSEKDFNVQSVTSLSFTNLFSDITTEFLPPLIEYLCIRNFFGTIRDISTLDHLHTMVIPTLDILNIKLPQKLERLTIADNQNVKIPPNFLPKSLEYLTLKQYSIKIEQETLPIGLKYLDLGNKSYNHPLESSLPPNLTHLNLGDVFDRLLLPCDLPNTIKLLKIGYGLKQEIGLGVLPLELRYLEITSFQNYSMVPGVLPDKLKELYISGGNSPPPFKIDSLPNGLEILHLSGFNSASISPGVLPDSLKHLKLYDLFNHTISPLAISAQLERLEFGSEFNQPLNFLGSSTPNLKYLLFGASFNASLNPGELPESLLEIHFGLSFNKGLYKGILPKNLVTLSLGLKFSQPETQLVLPDSLITVRAPITCSEILDKVVGNRKIKKNYI